MSTFIILLISTTFLLAGCKSNEINDKPKNDEKTIEEIIEQAKKKNNISVLREDSIKSGRIIKESFLTFEFGDSKNEVNKKIKSLMVAKKIIRRDNPYLSNELKDYLKQQGAKTENYIYNMKFENNNMDFLVDFEYCENKLYLIRLSYYTGSAFNPSISPWDKDKIVEIYKAKYKSKWFINNYIPINSTVDHEEYENLEGTRYISLIFTEYSLDIIYKDIKLERMKEEKNLSDTKNDI